jgi:hypothetical protein
MRMTKIHFDPGPFRKKFMLTVFFALIKRYCFAKFRRKPLETVFYRFSHPGRIISFQKVNLNKAALAPGNDA